MENYNFNGLTQDVEWPLRKRYKSSTRDACNPVNLASSSTLDDVKVKTNSSHQREKEYRNLPNESEWDARRCEILTRDLLLSRKTDTTFNSFGSVQSVNDWNRAIQSKFALRRLFADYIRDVLFFRAPTIAFQHSWGDQLVMERYIGGGSYGRVFLTRVRNWGAPLPVVLKISGTFSNTIHDAASPEDRASSPSLKGDTTDAAASSPPCATSLSPWGKVQYYARNSSRPAIFDNDNVALMDAKMEDVDFHASILEIRALKLLSGLVEDNICPHFLCYYGDFYEPWPVALKKNKGRRIRPASQHPNSQPAPVNGDSLSNSTNGVQNSKLLRNMELLNLRLSRLSSSTLKLENSAMDSLIHKYEKNMRCIYSFMEAGDLSLREWLSGTHRRTKAIMSMCFQICAAICWMSTHYDIVSNDLFSRNIVCSRVEPNLVYRYRLKTICGEDRVFDVPLHGFIFKVIDFSVVTSRKYLFRDHSREFQAKDGKPFSALAMLQSLMPAWDMRIPAFARDLACFLWSLHHESSSTPNCIPAPVLKWATRGLLLIEQRINNFGIVYFEKDSRGVVDLVSELFSPSVLTECNLGSLFQENAFPLPDGVIIREFYTLEYE